MHDKNSSQSAVISGILPYVLGKPLVVPLYWHKIAPRSLTLDLKWRAFKRSYFQKQQDQPPWDSSKVSPKASQTVNSKSLLTSAALGHVTDEGIWCSHHRCGAKQIGQDCASIGLLSKGALSLWAAGPNHYKEALSSILRERMLPIPCLPLPIQEEVQFSTVMPQKAEYLSHTSIFLPVSTVNRF